MIYKYRYKTPDGLDDILLNSDGEALTGLWFEGSKDAVKHSLNCREKELSVFRETCSWLDLYFSGRQPDFMPNYRIDNFTPFRKDVFEIMCKIPFCRTLTYGEIAAEIAKNHGIEKISARAVGGAVGWNPICIIIPCHRVVGSDKNLTGYGGGIKNKIALLTLEGIDMSKFVTPKKGTAL